MSNSSGRLLLRQIGYEQRAFWRNPARAFFSFLFPVMFLFIFATLNGNARLDEGPFAGARFVTYFVPGILAFGIVGTTFTNLAISLAYQRELGVLKRVQGTPLPRWVYLGGIVGSAIVLTVLLSALTIGIGVVVYGVRLRTDTLPALVTAIVAGTAAFSALGVAITGLLPNADAAPAVANALVLPLSFFSGVWFQVVRPQWLVETASWLPLRPLAESMQHAFYSRTPAPGFMPRNLAVLAAWFAAGALLALRTFRWQNTSD